jgi:hypothetical protein
MSTISFSDLLKICIKAKKELKPILLEKVKKQYTTEVCELIDNINNGLSNTPFLNENANEMISYIIRKQFRKKYEDFKKNFERNSINLTSSVMFFAGNDKILFKIFGEIPEVISYFENLPNVIDYHYQNQCDPPDNINEDDYNKRGDEWDEAVPNKYSDTGFIFEIFENDNWNVIFDENYIPTNEIRLKKIGRTLLWVEVSDKFNKENTDKSNFPYCETIEYEISELGQNRIKQLLENIKLIEITKEIADKTIEELLESKI